MTGNQHPNNGRQTPQDPYAGKIIDQYTVIRKLAQGGMGIVLLAQEPSIKQQIVLKGMLGGAQDADMQLRFKKEAEAAAALNSPHIAKPRRFFVYNGMPFYSMDLLPGKDLHNIIHNVFDPRTGKYMPLNQVANIARQQGAAITHAHSKGIIHRDLKPAQIVINLDLNPWHSVLTDFGLARIIAETESMRLTQTGDAIGTPAYFSPETISREGASKAVDYRADIHGLALIIGEMLHGITPPVKAEGVSTLAVCEAILNDRYHTVEENRPDLPQELTRELDVILAKGRHKDPAQRYQSAQGLGDEVFEVLDEYTRKQRGPRRKTPPRGSQAAGSGMHNAIEQVFDQDEIRAQGRRAEQRSEAPPSRSSRISAYRNQKSGLEKFLEDPKKVIAAAVGAGAIALAAIFGMSGDKPKPVDPTPVVVEQPVDNTPKDPVTPDNGAQTPVEPTQPETNKSYVRINVDGNSANLSMQAREFEQNEQGIYLPTGEAVDVQSNGQTELEPGRHLLYVSDEGKNFRVPLRIDEDSTQRVKVFVPNHRILPGFIYINNQEGRQYCFQISQREISTEQYFDFIEQTWARRTAGHELKRRLPGFPAEGNPNYTNIFERSQNGQIVPIDTYSQLSDKLNQPVTGLMWGLVRDDYINWAGKREVPEGLRLGVPSARQILHVVTADGLFKYGNRDEPQDEQERQSLEQYLTAINSMETFGEFALHPLDTNAFGVEGMTSGAPEEYIFTESTSAGNKNINILHLTREGYQTKPRTTRTDGDRNVRTGFHVVIYDQR